jgi:hypothetical protein
MLLFVATLGLLKVILPGSRKEAVLAILVALFTASLMGGPVQDLAMRLLHIRQAQTGHFEAYESQRVEIHFPKKAFLQINLGQDIYRRLSYVFETQVLKPFRPTLDEGGYNFIFFPKVLAIHWLGTWLGFFSIFLFRNRNRPALLLWTFGMLAYLVPGIVDFGPVHEKEYFRWEFAAGFGLCGALALGLAPFFRGRWGVALGVLALAVCWGGEMRLNQAWIWLQSEPNPALARPWYPSQRDWLLHQKNIPITADEIDMAVRMHARLGAEDRVVTDVDARGRDLFNKEGTLAGLMGCRVVGHLAPPRWMQDGIRPYFHTPNWSVWWQDHDLRAGAGLEANWAFSTQPQGWLDGAFKAVERINQVAVYPLPDSAGSVEEAPPGLQIENLALPAGATPQSEVAVPLEAEASNTETTSLSWRGIWEIRSQGGELDGKTRLLLSDSLELKPGEQKKLKLWFVSPLHEGSSLVELHIGDKVMAHMDFANPVKALLSQLTLCEVRYTGREGEDNKAILVLGADSKVDVAGPIRVGWRIYDKQEQRYQTPYGLDGFETVEIHLEAGQTREIATKIRIPEPAERFRIDFFLWTYTGAEVPLKPAAK